jgi:hypothetical protein
MQEVRRSRPAWWLLGVPLGALPVPAAAAELLLADNSQVLQTWQEATGAAQPPEIGKNADGETVVTFQGGVLWDKYVNDVSEPSGLPGNTTMTPSRSGSFYKLQAQGDLRGTSPEGDITYAQVAMTSSDDRAAQGSPLLVNTFQFGRVGPGYQLAFGDVSPNFSSLGTSTSLRGALLQRQFSDHVVGALTVGTLAESWAALSNKIYRTQLLRDAYGAKLDYQMGESGGLYLTTQGYSDRDGSLPNGVSAMLPASSHAHTLGFNYLRDNLSVQGEFGASRWQEEGRQAYSDNATILDATWGLSDFGLRAGYHKLGAYYTSLAAAGGAGIEETYVGGDWRAADWASFNADLRRSRNDAAAGSTNGQRTDSLTTGANINFGDRLPGLGLSLQYATSNASLDVGGHTKNDNYGGTLYYAGGAWNGGLGYGYSKMRNDASADSNGHTSSWSVNLGRSFAGEAGSWSAGSQFAASVGKQELDSGKSSRDRTLVFSVYGQSTDWGSLTASVIDGLMTETTGGADLRTRSYQFDASHPFGKKNTVKAYWRSTSSFSGDPGLGYRERTVGLQVILMI